VELKRVGEASDLISDASPLQLLSEGVYDGKAFQIVGRIRYTYELGRWNEWHIVFQDGQSGWLSDAQLEYAVSFAVQQAVLPAASELYSGKVVHLAGAEFEVAEFEVTVLTHASYDGVEGELPFEYWDKSEVVFADLRTATGRFATIDYSEPEPLLFIGMTVDFEDLKLRGLREFEGWRAGE
jgi:hypothetical protein